VPVSLIEIFVLPRPQQALDDFMVGAPVATSGRFF
jgi:hypothetical protein